MAIADQTLLTRYTEGISIYRNVNLVHALQARPLRTALAKRGGSGSCRDLGTPRPRGPPLPCRCEGGIETNQNSFSTGSRAPTELFSKFQEETSDFANIDIFQKQTCLSMLTDNQAHFHTLSTYFLLIVNNYPYTLSSHFCTF